MVNHKLLQSKNSLMSLFNDMFGVNIKHQETTVSLDTFYL